MGETPVQRWRAAVSQVPLEPARPFPAPLRPLVARLAGSPDRPSYTTGPATRRALAAAGALGATTGTVVHLATPPSTHPSAIGVLAHELSHARHPVSRPRFLLSNPLGGLDVEERAARAVGEAVQAAAGGDVAGTVTGAVTRAAGAGLGRLGDAGETAAGIVGALPVGGAGAAGMAEAVAQVARTAVADSVRETVVSTLQQAVPGADLTGATGGFGDLAQRAAGAAGLAGMAGAAGQLVTGEAGQLAGAAGQLATGAAGVAGAAGSAVGAAAGTAAGAAATAAGPLAGVDLDRLTEALEERLLRQIERRGGRYAGVF